MSNKYIHFHNNNIGLYYHYQIEKYIWHKLNVLKTTRSVVTDHRYESIPHTEKELGFKFTSEQIRAIKGLSESNVIIITGAAGTGKSQTLRAITDSYSKYSIGLCSLSAMAAAKMADFTGLEASTIHKMLGWNGTKFKYNDDNYLPYRIIIVDEMSMNNTWIFQHLLRAIEPGCKLILVGDSNQVSPIGAGNVFYDLLQSEMYIYWLTIIHRQAQESGIIMDANAIKDGINPLEDTDIIPDKWFQRGKLKDMYYFFTNNKNYAQSVAIRTYLKAVQNTSVEDVALIVPRKRNAPLSTSVLNKVIQSKLHKSNESSITNGDIKLYMNDKIVQRENDYKDKGVINGEIGYVSRIDNQDRSLAIRFGQSKVIKYMYTDLDEINLAYSLTCHLFQGNQSPMVITSLDYSHMSLLSNELLYTAITRASKKCLFIGNYSAFMKAINTKLSKRKTILSTLIK